MITSSRTEIQNVRCELAAQVLRSQETLHLPATGSSMLPTIWPGDSLIIEPLSGDTVELGEVVLFTRNGRFVAHRVVEKIAGKIHTQGDAASRPDAPLTLGDLMGKVSMIVRNGRLIQLRGRQHASGRPLSALLQRSDFAARMVLGAHRIHCALRKRVSREAASRPTSSVRVSPCQN